jgi:tetratricopeptide (TPR) repeat protein
MEKPKPTNGKGRVAKPVSSGKLPPPGPVAPLFRRIDWIVLGLVFAVMWAIYLMTLAPELTLEDSGELCTGAFYAGIPHPPGYPFWTIYAWFWTAILPIGSVAWRVEVGESFAMAMGCGMLALMVSRGSSMLIEGIEELKDITRNWEGAICMVSGIVAGMMVGLDGFVWSESVAINRISLFAVPWLILVLLMLMRWMYAPHQKRYLYLAMLFYGICATIHQTLLLSAVGIEVAIAAVQPRLGRDLFLTNSILYLIGLFLLQGHSIPALNNMTSIETAIFHVVGVGSFAAWNWLYLKPLIESKRVKDTWLRMIFWGTAAIVCVFLLFFFLMALSKPAPGAAPDSFPTLVHGQIQQIGWRLIEAGIVLYGAALAVCSLVSLWMSIETRELYGEWKTVIFMGILWALGVSFYLYEPLSGMTVPPMQWGYPRTVEGFFHALSRGQYETSHGTNIFQDPVRFVNQLWYLVQGLSESFSWVFMFVGALPFLFLFKMHKRERSWIIGLTAIYFCLAVLLVNLLDVGLDRSSADLNKVFFTASHALFAIMIGYGLTLMAAYMATHYARFRFWGMIGGAGAIILALYCLADAAAKLFVGPGGEATSILSQLPHLVAQAFAKDQYGLPILANLILVAMPVIFILALLVYRSRGPVLILLGLFMVMPVYSGLSHWYKSEQRNHWFGYWFGHDMFTPPFGIYPEMTRDAILFGGTDPGRFCPTYIIFCESFIPHSCQPKEDQKFDRRDVYIITQNALADGTYLDYLRSQYNRSMQHDPPFFSELSKYSFSLAAHMWRKAMGSAYDSNDNHVNEDSPPEAQQRAALDRQREADMCQSISDSGLFKNVNQMLYQVLDVPFTKFGAHVEAKRRAGRVYPPVEIYIPSPEDLQRQYDTYREDFQRRFAAGQLQPGEGVQTSGNQMAISGQISVMKINGLLCKVIFDHNPTNEFFVEESFPLDWMYPYETPFGVIMKIHRNPLPELSSDVFKKDHEFWSKYSGRFIGNWITYDTSIQQIADFADKVYLHGNFSGFTGDRKFIRDDDGQKAFSKLRSSQAGVYAWRLGQQCPPEYRQKTAGAQDALIRETDFAFKQAFAFCPYSPEAVFRYINFLLQYNRLDDALIVAKTCLKFDPYNGQAIDLVNNLENFKKQSADRNQLEQQLQRMEAEQQNNPTNFQNTLELARFYIQIQQTNRAVELLRNALGLFDQALANPNIRYPDVAAMAQIAAQVGDTSRLEILLQKLVSLAPDQPEPHYDVAALDAILGKTSEALQNLKTSLDLNARRLATNPTARDILAEARNDHRFDSLRNLPAFQKLVPPG